MQTLGGRCTMPSMTQRLTGYQRSALLKEAHHRKPVATIGKAGPGPEVRAHIDRELEHHELIKIKFADFKEERREITSELCDALGAVLVAVIGNVGIIYRRAADPEAQRIHLPTRSRAEGVGR